MSLMTLGWQVADETSLMQQAAQPQTLPAPGIPIPVQTHGNQMGRILHVSPSNDTTHQGANDKHPHPMHILKCALIINVSP